MNVAVEKKYSQNISLEFPVEKNRWPAEGCKFQDFWARLSLKVDVERYR